MTDMVEKVAKEMRPLMTEPYHPFIKRAPSGDDRQDNLCAQCGKSPMDGVHNPTPENYPPMRKSAPTQDEPAEGKP